MKKTAFTPKQIFFTLLLLTCSSALAETVNDVATDYAPLSDQVTALTNQSGQTRIDSATTLKTTVQSVLTRIENLIDGVPALEGDDATTATAIQNGSEGLLLQLDDHITIATIERDLDTAQASINTLSADNISSVNSSHVTIAQTLINSTKTAADAINSAGLGNAGGILTAELGTNFDIQYLRVEPLKELIDVIEPFMTKYNALLVDVGDVPRLGGDDTTIITKQAIVEATAQEALTLADAVSPKVTAIGSAVSDFKTNLAALRRSVEREYYLAEIGRLSADARITEKEMLLATPDEKRLLKASLQQKRLLVITQENAFKLFEMEAMILDAEGDITTGVNDALTEIAQYASGYEAGLTSTLQRLSQKFIGNSASADMQRFIRETIDELVNERQAALNLLGASTAMNKWLREQRSGLDDINDYETAIADMKNHWGDFVAGYTLFKNNNSIATNAQTALSSVDSELGTLFSELPTEETIRDVLTEGLRQMAQVHSQTKREYNRQVRELLNSIESIASQQPTLLAKAFDPLNAKEKAATPDSFTLTLNTQNNDDLDAQISTIDGSSTILLSGDSVDFARLREIALNSGSKTNAQIKIFLQKSARIGLGTTNLSSNPGQTLNILGSKSATLIPDENGFVDVNSDLLITDDTPLIPTENFGKLKTHRLTFTSEVERKIIVLAGVTLNLTAFNSYGDDYPDFAKQISFGGKVKLILEPGAKIRFPFMPDGQEKKAPVLYFNEDSEFIILGTENRDEERWTDGLSGSNKVRNKIMGVGQIWLNKNAKMRVMNSALVGIEADYNSPKTHMTISIQREAKLLIGTENSAGGSFQVGNVVDGGDGDENGPNNDTNTGDSFVPSPTEINFSLKLNGPGAECALYREGFLGLGVGTVNKADNPNGDALETDNPTTEGVYTPSPETAWRIQSLHNVTNVLVDIEQGILRHNNISDGSSSSATLMGIGPLVEGGKYIFKLGPQGKAIVLGGGNIIFLDDTIPHTEPLPVNIWQNSIDLTDSDNAGKYSILSPDIIMRKKQERVEYTDEGETFTTQTFGRSFISSSDAGYVFAGPQEEFFSALKMNDYIKGEPYIAIGKDQFDVVAGYVNGTTIKRRVIENATDSEGRIVSPQQALPFGYLLGSTPNSDNDPQVFIIATS